MLESISGYIKGMIEEENDAVSEYNEFGDLLSGLGFRSEAQKVYGIARDESRHRDVLKKIRSTVNQNIEE